MSDAHTYAKDFLRPYVARGDTVEKICRYSRASVCATLYTIQIGGEVYFQGKHHYIHSEQIVIKELAGQPCLYIFEVASLLAELGVLGRITQLALWG